MNVQRFTGRTSREAMQKMREALGDDAVVLSTKPCVEGIEMLAMAPGALAAVEQHAASTAPRSPEPKARPQARAAAMPAPVQAEVQSDVAQLAMSTLSFQDYVRERMLKKRDAALRAEAAAAQRVEPTVRAEPQLGTMPSFQRAAAAPQPPHHADRMTDRAHGRSEDRALPRDAGASQFGGFEADAVDSAVGAVRQRVAQQYAAGPAPAARQAAPLLREEVAAPRTRSVEAPATAPVQLRDPQSEVQMLNELRSMKGLIEERFGALAFMEKLQRQPAQARLTQKLLEVGFSPILIRKLVAGLTPEVADETAWAASILERNLMTGERELAIEDQGGVFALTGATGVGKTTSTAKLAAAFATRHGASNLGLVTLDAYRMGAHEQLRAYGRILGVPVHTAHDRPALEDLLDLLSAKKMVLIDTAGLAQRDARTRELLDMLAHRSINRLLVVNTAVQGETIDDVLVSYRAETCKGIVLSKLDEAVKLAPALDAVIRHRQKIVAVANGQRVPEDWHRLSGNALVHRALRATGSAAYNFDASEMNLVFAAPQMSPRRANAAPV